MHQMEMKYTKWAIKKKWHLRKSSEREHTDGIVILTWGSLILYIDMKSKKKKSRNKVGCMYLYNVLPFLSLPLIYFKKMSFLHVNLSRQKLVNKLSCYLVFLFCSIFSWCAAEPLKIGGERSFFKMRIKMTLSRWYKWHLLFFSLFPAFLLKIKISAA